MRHRVFLSHNSADKDFVRRLATDLRRCGQNIWLDEWDIRVGDSLIQRISDGVDESAYLVAVISQHSVVAPWVTEELNLAMTDQIGGYGIAVLPVRLDDSKMPHFLRSRLYADFRDPMAYQQGLNSLLRAMGCPPTEVAAGHDVRWFCTYCGWGCTQHYNDYLCNACRAVRVIPIGSPTQVKCRSCGGWELAVATYCSTCGARLR